MNIKHLAAALALGTALPMAAVAQVPASTADLTPMAGLSTQDYVAKAADGDMYETMSSKMALQRSKMKPTRTLAQMMVRDHTRSTDMLKKAAAKASVSVPTAPTAETQAKLDALQAASDNDFDQLYGEQQKQAHDTAWTVHAGYAQDGQDAGLKRVATTVRQTVEQHKRHLATLAVKKPSGS